MATTQTACRVCAGDLSLRVAGTNGHAPVAEAFAPSRHETGRHGDLLACVECGTVQQPLLPAGDELHELYRDMSDEAYLGEEAGRRATAAHLLDLIGAQVAAGRLLDVGCGHGLLLDEARSRGYETVGLELSRSAARHAREALGLDVHEQPVESFVDLDGFDVVVLADVIEHLDDPVAAVDRCAGLLRPGGVLCVVTPDPSSMTARIAGRRWWGFVPAHACLLPRATLRELLAARGLVISADVPLVRSFSARRWVCGLAERLGPVGRPVERLADALPDGASLSLALHDERVILANRIDVRRAPTPLLRDRGGPAIVTLVLPAYEATRTIPEVAAEIPVDAADRALLVDDASHDATAEVALAHGFDVIRHPREPRLRRQPEDRLRAGAARRRRRDRHGPRRQPVRAGARARDGGADPRGRGRHGHRLAAAARPRDRRRHAALEVAGQPHAHRHREPRLRRRALRVPHRLPRLLGGPAALDPVPAQLRRLRLRPGDLRAGPGARRARGRGADPDALLPRGVERRPARRASATA